jgi:hypothetical protein
MLMVENPMTTGNIHDLSKDNVHVECAHCGGEIYIGDAFIDFDGIPLHTDEWCVKGYVTSHYQIEIAGE